MQPLSRSSLHKLVKVACRQPQQGSCGALRPLSTTSAACSNKAGGKLKLPYKVESPLAPLGVTAAIDKSLSNHRPKRKILAEFSLTDRVALVSGSNRGLGLEMAMALGEAGARVVYCIDLPQEPSEDWIATRDYLASIPHDPAVNGNNKHARLEYISEDVTNQERMWAIGQEIGDKEKRMDICVAAAGIASQHISCLEYPADAMRRIVDVNMNGALFTAQAAGRQMQRFGTPGSIVLIASMSGSVTNKDQEWVSYNSSKAGVIQMARSMACELGKVGIRVNTVSPGYIYTKMSAAELDAHPDLLEEWSDLTPMNRIGRPDELRGTVTWLASDASSYCTGSDILVSGGYTAW